MNGYDIEEIIAEIKSEDGYSSKKASEKKSGDAKRSDRSLSRASKKAADTKKSSAPKKSPAAKNTKASSSTSDGSLFEKDLQEFISSDIPKKRKAKASKIEAVEILDLKKEKTASSEHKDSPQNETDKHLPYDFVNRLYNDPDEAVGIITKRTVSLTVRLLALVVVFLAALYMTLVFPLKLPLPFGFSYFKTPYLYLLVYFILDLLAVLLAADVTASGLFRLIKGKPTLDTLVLFSSIASMAYILTVLIKPQWGAWLPFTAASCGQCFFGLIAKRNRYLSLKRTYRVLQTNSSPVAVKAQGPRRDRVLNKTYKNVFPEMADLCSPDGTEKLGFIYAPLAILICIVLAAAASFGRQDPKSFTWCLSALSVMALSPAILISSALPSSIATKRLYTSGTALINNRAGNHISSCSSAIITDEDVFPNGSVVINSLKVDDAYTLEYAYSVAASALEAIGGGLYHVFDEAAKQLYGEKYPIGDIKFFENGGMSAKIDGKYVLLGNVSFIRRMGVHTIPAVKLQNCLYMAIDSRFAGVFSLKYAAQNTVFSAFRMFKRAKCTPILATRDFLTTEAFIEDKFKLRADSCEYPGIETRVELSSDRFPDSDVLAVLSRSSMYSYSELLLSCRRLRRSIVFNLLCSIVGIAVGLFIMYFLVSNMEVASASPVNILIYLACWTVPVWLSSHIFTRF